MTGRIFVDVSYIEEEELVLLSILLTSCFDDER